MSLIDDGRVIDMGALVYNAPMACLVSVDFVPHYKSRCQVED